MDTKYGRGEGIQGLRRLIKTGDYNSITRTNGSRETISKIPMEIIEKYLNTI